MSQTDSFIEEVTEEVKRDRLYKNLRKYGWIGVVAVLAIVGGTAWTEISKARYQAAAAETGDAILAALDADGAEARVSALQGLTPADPASGALIQMLIASEQASADDRAGAAQTLRAASENGDVPQIYRQVAAFKAILQAGSDMAPEERRLQLEALATPGNPIRLLAEEQLALVEIESGQADAAVERLRRISDDAEATAGLRLRASRLMLALGVSPDPA